MRGKSQKEDGKEQEVDTDVVFSKQERHQFESQKQVWMILYLQVDVFFN